MEKKEEQNHASSNDMFGIEVLLAEGKAAAQAKLKEPAVAVGQVQSTDTKRETTGLGPPTVQRQQSVPSTQQSELNNQGLQELSTKLIDVDYSDVLIWLEYTGYHDVEYRNAKLATYKERRLLEEEAARIQARLDKLKEDEKAIIASVRANPAHPTRAELEIPPAPLPMIMPNNIHHPSFPPREPMANGIKRAHSPDPETPDKLARRPDHDGNGFRIRGGANESPEDRHQPLGRVPTGLGFERRISYPQPRRVSVDDVNNDANGNRLRSRDPSLERRKASYKRDGQPATAHPRDGRLVHGGYNERDSTERHGFAERRPSTGPRFRGNYQPHGNGLELGKGGKRTFLSYD